MGTETKGPSPTIPKGPSPTIFLVPFIIVSVAIAILNSTVFFYTIFSTRMKSKEVKRRHESHEKGIFLSFFEQ